MKITIGICTTGTRKQSYLSDTINSIRDGVGVPYLDCFRLVVLDCDLCDGYAPHVIEAINEFGSLVEFRKIDKSAYPPFFDIPRHYDENPETVAWRSKLTYDAGLLFDLCSSFGDDYVMRVEDDIAVSRHFGKSVTYFLQMRKDQKWAAIKFSDIGFIGHLMRTRDAKRAGEFLKALYYEMPADWLIERFYDVIEQNSGKVIPYVPSLFAHKGYHRSTGTEVSLVSSQTFIG